MESGAAMQWLNMLAGTSQVIVLIPVAFVVLALDELNYFLLMLNIIALQFVFDFGLANVLTRLIVQGKVVDLVVDGATFTSNELLVVSKIVFAVLTGISFLVILLIAIFSMKSSNASEGLGESSILMISIVAALSVSISVYNKYYISILNANELLAWQNKIKSAITLFSILLASLIGYLNQSIYWLLSSAIISESIAFFVFRLRSKRIAPKIEKSVYSISLRPLARYVFSMIGKTGFGMIFGFAIIQLSGVYASSLFELGVSASYLLSLRLLALIRRFSGPPFYSQLPVFNKLYAERRILELLPLARRRMLFVFVIYMLSALVVYFFGNTLAVYFNKTEVTIRSDIWLLVIVLGLLERLGAMFLQLYTLSNVVKWHIANGITGIVTISSVAFFHPLVSLQLLLILMIIPYALVYVPYCYAKYYLHYRAL